MKRVLATSILLITAAVSAASIFPRHSAKQKLTRAAVSEPSDPKAAVQIVEGPKVAYVSAHHAVVQWTTNVAANSELHYGLSADNLDKSERSRNPGKAHRIQISKLKADTEYHFKVTSSGAGGSVTSDVGSFRTNTRGERPNRYPEQRN